MEDIVTQRVNEFRQSLGLSNRGLALKLGMLPETLNKQLKEGGYGVSVSTIVLILSTYPNLSAEWLMRGEGEMAKPAFGNTARIGDNRATASLLETIDNLNRMIAMLTQQQPKKANAAG